MSNIVVIGSLNMDLVITTPKVPNMGETILGNGFITVPGGKGANQAVAVSRLGGEVTMIGCVGNDIFGKDLIQNLKENNVNVDNINIINDCATGIAMIVLKDGDNFIIVDSGANDQLSPSIIDKMEEVIKLSNIVMIQLEIPKETVDRAIMLARKHGIKVLLNPAPARKLSDELLESVNIFTPNESECEIITGMPVKSIEDAKKAVGYLLEKGIEQVIITLGGKGIVYNSGVSIIHKPVENVEVIDTTAAGDSFSGAIAFAVSQGKTIDEAVDFANIVGTLTVTKKGAQTSLPLIKDVEDFIRNRT